MTNAHKRRFAALLNACPKCEAPSGVACGSARGERKALHRERRALIDRAVVDRLRYGSPDNFYGSDEWRRSRYKALRREGGCCQCCGARASMRSPLHVDHIKPRARFPELALDPNNLQVMCEDCNLGKGASDTINWRRGVA